MAFALKAHWAIGIALVTTASAGYGVIKLQEHLKSLPPQPAGSCKNAFYANGTDCLAKDKNGNPISISIDTPATPRP